MGSCASCGGGGDDLFEQLEELKERLGGSLVDVETMVNLGSIYMYLNMHDEARFMFMRAKNLAPDSAAAAFGLASYAFNRGQAEAAEEMLREVTTRHSSFEPAHRLLSTIYAESDRLEEALEAMKLSAEAAQPEDPDVPYLLGNLYDDNDMPDDAMAEYEKTIAIDPNYAPAYNSMACIHADNENWDAAVSSARKALSINPTYSNAHLNLAQAFLNHPDIPVQDAEDEFNKALEFDEGNVDACIGLAEIYYDDENFRKSVEMYEKAVELDPESAEVAFSLGSAYFASGEMEEAMNAYRAAINLDEEFAPPRFWAAEVLRKSGSQLEAAIGYSTYLEFEPDGDSAAAARDALSNIKDWQV